MSEVKDYRVTVKVRNNRILKAIENVGGIPGSKWCKSVGLSYPALNNLINMKTSPYDSKNFSLTLTASKLCEVTDTLPEDLWSSEQIYPLEKNMSELELSSEQMQQLIGVDSSDQPYLARATKEAKHIVAVAVASLTPREADVLAKRYQSDMSLDAVANAHGVSRERIRQIEAKALRKLRHPSRVDDMKEAAAILGVHVV